MAGLFELGKPLVGGIGHAAASIGHRALDSAISHEKGVTNLEEQLKAERLKPLLEEIGATAAMGQGINPLTPKEQTELAALQHVATEILLDGPDLPR